MADELTNDKRTHFTQGVQFCFQSCKKRAQKHIFAGFGGKNTVLFNFATDHVKPGNEATWLTIPIEKVDRCVVLNPLGPF